MAEKNRKPNRATTKKAVKKITNDDNELFQFDKPKSIEPDKIKEKENTLKTIELDITNIPIEDADTSLKSNVYSKSDTQFDFSKPIYIEIHRGNIFHYFASGLVTPTGYISNRAFPDMQSIKNDALLLANDCSSSDTNDLVLLEIQILDSEKESIALSNNIGFLFQPIPTTRIKNIFVKSEEVRNTIMSDSLVFDGGYIPASLIKASFPSKIEKHKFDIPENLNLNGSDFTSKIDSFNRILGLLAFLRNYNLLISEKTNSYKTLPNHFFYAMQAIDKSFGTEFVSNNIISEFYGYLFNGNCPSDKQLLKWIFERLNVQNNFNDSDTKEFEKLYNQNINESEYEKIVKQVFFSLSKNMERKGAIETAENIKSKSALPLYLFAFLRNYASLNSIEISRRDITSVPTNHFGEYAFALLGFFFGYKSLRNTDERINSSNPLMKLLNNIPSKPPIKFELTTEFDYLILELVYSHVFYGVINQVKLATLQIEHIQSDKLPATNINSKEYKFTEGLIYGKLYQSLSPSDPLAELISLLNKLPNDIPLLSEFGWYCYRLGIKMKPVSLSDISFSLSSIIKLVGYSKEELIRHLEMNKRKIDIDELQARINLSQKSNEI
ncbi:MAG: hypothetical protein ABI729_06255 [Chitinophagales bacterium]